jgi:DNA-binding MarR family transcriptional regulator
MILADRKLHPEEILQDSILLHLAAAYFSISKRLEQKTHCPPTRGFVMSTLRDGATLNQNQIATLLGIDRTLVHRSIKTMVEEGLVSERKGKFGRAMLVQLTAKGNKYRENLIPERRAVEEKLRKQLTLQEIYLLLRVLKLVAEREF